MQGLGSASELLRTSRTASSAMPTARAFARSSPSRRWRSCSAAAEQLRHLRLGELRAKARAVGIADEAVREVLRSSEAEPSPCISRSARAPRLRISPPSGRCDSV